MMLTQSGDESWVFLLPISIFHAHKGYAWSVACAIVRYIRYSDCNEGLNNWCLVLKLSYG